LRSGQAATFTWPDKLDNRGVALNARLNTPTNTMKLGGFDRRLLLEISPGRYAHRAREPEL